MARSFIWSYRMENDFREILLVEDNPLDIDLTKRAFARRRLANPLLIACDGEEAMQYIDRWENGEQPPALILLDLKLPKVDGLEVLARLKNHNSFKLIPVVVLTTSAEDRDVQAAYRLGANSYIVKPVSFEKFMDVVGHIEIYWGVLNQPWDKEY
jgi:CheY-like chemotaxis protein